MKAPKEEKKVSAPAVDYGAEVSKQLAAVLGRKVRLVDGKRTGRIELEYYGADDREALIAALSGLRFGKK